MPAKREENIGFRLHIIDIIGVEYLLRGAGQDAASVKESVR
jgi:hypothetical protein